ncbi:hypothetical protein WMF17_30705 [Sorangium sp. So ce362]
MSVEGAEVGVAPGLEEGLADVADGALDAALLVAAGDGHGARLEAVMRRQSQQRGVELDRVAVALDDGALEVARAGRRRVPIGCSKANNARFYLDEILWGERLWCPASVCAPQTAR